MRPVTMTDLVNAKMKRTTAQIERLDSANESGATIEF